MEIRDYLRAIRRILWLVIAVPIAAALLTGGFMELQPSIYEADATVVVPAISGNGSSSSAATQYVAGFKDVLVSQPVLTEVLRNTRSRSVIWPPASVPARSQPEATSFT